MRIRIIDPSVTVRYLYKIKLLVQFVRNGNYNRLIVVVLHLDGVLKLFTYFGVLLAGSLGDGYLGVVNAGTSILLPNGKDRFGR